MFPFIEYLYLNHYTFYIDKQHRFLPGIGETNGS